MIIKKKLDWYRPNYININNKEYEISKIFIYENNEIKYFINCGWLEHYDLKLNFGRDIKQFNLKNDVIKSTKLNLNRKDNFIISDKEDYTKGRYKLYIHISEIKVLNKTEFLDYETFTTKEFKTITEIELFNVRNEAIEYNKELDKVIYKDVEFKTFNLVSERRTEKKPIFEQLEQFKKQLEKDNIKINSYNVEELFKKYNITKKEVLNNEQ